MRASRVAVLEARIAQLTARKTAVQRRETRIAAKSENRRKFLLGAYVLRSVGGDISRLNPEILRGLDAWATRKCDRDALGLPAPDKARGAGAS